MTNDQRTLFASDPFFRLDGDPEWNAYVGRQGAEQFYVEGFLSAALELADAVLDKNQWGKRDTLVMPILYNARHGVELALKFCLARLARIEFTPAPVADHDIGKAFGQLSIAAKRDLALRELLAQLSPYVTSLMAVDEDGQQLRYRHTRAGEQTLDQLSLVNLETVRDSLRKLADVLELLMYRTLDLLDEHATGTFTPQCSRRDLYNIAKSLPPRTDWPGGGLEQINGEIRERYGLSNTALKKVFGIFERHRELGAITGLEFPLAHLSDESAVRVAKRWAEIQPPPLRSGESRVRVINTKEAGALSRLSRLLVEVDREIVSLLTPDEIADMQTIFYIGRDRTHCEYYDELLAETKAEHAREGDLIRSVHHLTSKTSFAQHLAAGVERLGRPSLAASIRRASSAS